MSLDWNKPIQTFNGLNVRLFADSAQGPFPVEGIILFETLISEMTAWTLNGTSRDFPNWSLKNVPDVNEVEIVYYECTSGVDSGQRFACQSKNLPGLNSDVKYWSFLGERYKLIAIKKIQIIEGEGI